MGRSTAAPAAAVRATDPLRRDRVLIGLILVIAGSILVYGLDLGARSVQVVACWVLLLGLHVGLAVVARQVSRVPGIARTTRWIWAAIAIAGGTYALGDTAQLVTIAISPLDLAVAIGGTVQSFSVLLGTAVPILVALLVTAPVGGGSRRETTSFWLDVGIVMAAAATFGGYVYVPDGSRPAEILLSLLVGPGLFLVGVFAVVKLFLSSQPPFSRLAGLVLGAAAALEGAAQAATALLVDARGLSWLLGLTVVASAVLTGSARIQYRQTNLDTGVLGSRSRRRYSTLPYAAIAATYALLVWVLVHDGLARHTWIVVTGAIASTALVLGRQLVAFTDNARLLDELDAKVQELHQLLRERDDLEDRLRHEALHDPLTGLANRSMFNRRLQDVIREGDTPARPLTLMIVDLDDFKQVNDEYGHASGDQVLVAVARRLRGCVRDVDLVARLGGDEFALLLEDLPDDADRVASRIVEVIAQPVTFAVAAAETLGAAGPTGPTGPVSVCVSASVGVVIADLDRRTAEQLLHAADTTMYSAKRSGKGAYRVSVVTG